MKYAKPNDGAIDKTLTLRDGRTLAYFDNGVDSDRGLLLHHGTPGQGDLWQTWFEAAAARGVRAVAYTRAGYAGSDPAEGRSVISANDDFVELLEHLGIVEFVSVGWSGGGPYALASTFLQGSKGADLVAGVAPYKEMGSDWFLGLSESETPEATDKIADSLEGSLEMALIENKDVEATLSKQVLIDAAMARANYEQFSELYTRFYDFVYPAVITGLVGSLQGYAHDNHVIIKDWGFSVSQVNAPVAIWNGGLDKGVPYSHARWQHEQIKNSSLHLIDDQNHSSPMVELMREILDSAIAKLNV